MSLATSPRPSLPVPPSRMRPHGRPTGRPARPARPLTPPQHCIYAVGGVWRARTYSYGRYRHLGTFPSRSAAVAAYQAQVGQLPFNCPRSPSAAAVTTWHRGPSIWASVSTSVRPSNRTGYMNVHAHGCRFRAVVQSRVDGVKRVTTIGCYDSAVLAAHAYAVHILGSPSLP